MTLHQGFRAALFCFSVITNHGFLLSIGRRGQQQRKAPCVGAREGKLGPVCALQARGTLEEKLFCSACTATTGQHINGREWMRDVFAFLNSPQQTHSSGLLSAMGATGDLGTNDIHTNLIRVSLC